MVIRVYVWTDGFPGHAAMAYRDHVDKTQAHTKLYFSWMPVEARKLVQGAFARRERQMPKNYLSDKMKNPDAPRGKAKSADHKFTFYHLNERAVLEYWRNLIHSDGRDAEYQFLRHNCSTTVARALDAGNPGVPLPNHILWRPQHVLKYCSDILQRNFGDLDVKLSEKVVDVSQEKADQQLLGKVKPRIYRHKWNDVEWDDLLPEPPQEF